MLWNFSKRPPPLRRKLTEFHIMIQFRMLCPSSSCSFLFLFCAESSSVNISIKCPKIVPHHSQLSGGNVWDGKNTYIVLLHLSYITLVKALLCLCWPKCEQPVKVPAINKFVFVFLSAYESVFMFVGCLLPTKRLFVGNYNLYLILYIYSYFDVYI